MQQPNTIARHLSTDTCMLYRKLRVYRSIADGMQKEQTSIEVRVCDKKVVHSTVPAERPVTGLSCSSIKEQEGDMGQYMHSKVPRQQQAVMNRRMVLLFCMNGPLL